MRVSLQTADNGTPCIQAVHVPGGGAIEKSPLLGRLSGSAHGGLVRPGSQSSTPARPLQLSMILMYLGRYPAVSGCAWLQITVHQGCSVLQVLNRVMVHGWSKVSAGLAHSLLHAGVLQGKGGVRARARVHGQHR